MTNAIPEIKVISKIKKVTDTNPLVKDVVCLIGCFEDTETLTPTFCESLQAAEEIFGDDDDYDGNAALKQIFRKNISGVLIVNCTSTTGSGADVTVNRTLTQAKIEAALALVKLIDFDILYCAVELTDGMIDKIAAFCEDRFEEKRPCGYIGAGTRANASAYTTTSGKLGDSCYAYLTQTVTLGDSETALSLMEAGAYLTNVIATLPVGNSLTAKVLEEVSDIGTTYTFASGDLGEHLVEKGFFVLRLVNALDNSYEIVNSANANGLDLYISRVRDYIVNDFALREYLGERNNTITMDLIGLECARIYAKFVDELALVEDIGYVIEKASPSKVNVIINELTFAGVITEIDVYITIEVE